MGGDESKIDLEQLLLLRAGTSLRTFKLAALLLLLLLG